uniref:peptidylprolyl isomerase n=1 Tax=Schistocephalus solidus TaxID=70667 RepID=A0A0X3PPI5_SCHSO
MGDDAEPSDKVSPELEEESPEDFVDILGNGLVTKKVLKKGLGRDSRPNHGDSVVISYEGRLEDGTVVDKESHLSIVLGEGDCIHALRLALPLAELKEEFELKTDSRFAYGDLGRLPEIPGKAKLTYHVVLEQCGDPPCYEKMSKDHRFQIADRKREKGNYYFSRQEYQFALTTYVKAVEILTIRSDSDEMLSEIENDAPSRSLAEFLDLEIKLRNNVAASQLKLEAYQAASKTCDAVLQLDPTNSKALFRKGKALAGLGDFTEAITLFEKVLELTPSSSQAKFELAKARTAWKKMRERQRRAFGRSFKTTISKAKPTRTKLDSIKELCHRYRFALSALLVAGISVAIGAAVTRYQE